MVSNKDDLVDAEINQVEPGDQDTGLRPNSRLSELFDRQSYTGALLFNLAAFMLPVLYGTLSKLWVANIDSSQVVTTDVYIYIGVIVNVLNDGLPRTAWNVIGDKTTRTPSSRIGLTDTSLRYVRISSVEALSSAMEVAVASSTRALDHPDVPLLISSIKFIVNIVLDLLIISRFHVGNHAPTINTQALVRMVCDLTAALSGLVYFLHIATRFQRRSNSNPSNPKPRPSVSSLKTLVRPGFWTFIESALRNSIYLWLIHGIVSMGSDYATAWGVFNTIRWGIFMVTVQALEATTLTFVGHAWGKWRAEVGPTLKNPKASKEDLLVITRLAWRSCLIALALEVPICILLSIWGIKQFAFYLSESEPVALITQHMWKTIDWCYIFYAVNYQIAAIVIATTTRWFLIQALGSNLLWMLPWAIAVTRIGMTPENAWSYHSIIFGGALVFDFFNVSLVVGIWAWYLMKGKISLAPVHSSL
ncbi:hypothetical protein BGZ57DRAFT_938170 [Hyaloscypha finlandica]|nr:hypothetical protein BGZ57DRAFT_938170 [Hyaloscypha finlandica]